MAGASSFFEALLPSTGCLTSSLSFFSSFLLFYLESFGVSLGTSGFLASGLGPSLMPDLSSFRCFSNIFSNRPFAFVLRFQSSDYFASFWRSANGKLTMEAILCSSESIKLSKPIRIDSTFHTGFHDSGCQSLIVKQIR